MPRNSIIAIAVFLALAGQAGPAQAAGFWKGVYQTVRPRWSKKQVKAAIGYHLARSRWLQRLAGANKNDASVRHAPLLNRHHRKARRERGTGVLAVAKWSFRAFAAFAAAVTYNLGEGMPWWAKALGVGFTAVAIVGGEATRMAQETSILSRRFETIGKTKQDLPGETEYLNQLDTLRAEIVSAEIDQ